MSKDLPCLKTCQLDYSTTLIEASARAGLRRLLVVARVGSCAPRAGHYIQPTAKNCEFASSVGSLSLTTRLKIAVYYSDRNAFITSTREARAAGNAEAMTAAASSTSTDPTTGVASGNRISVE